MDSLVKQAFDITLLRKALAAIAGLLSITALSWLFMVNVGLLGSAMFIASGVLWGTLAYGVYKNYLWVRVYAFVWLGLAIFVSVLWFIPPVATAYSTPVYAIQEIATVVVHPFYLSNIQYSVAHPSEPSLKVLTGGVRYWLVAVVTIAFALYAWAITKAVTPAMNIPTKESNTKT